MIVRSPRRLKGVKNPKKSRGVESLDGWKVLGGSLKSQSKSRRSWGFQSVKGLGQEWRIIGSWGESIVSTGWKDSRILIGQCITANPTPREGSQVKTNQNKNKTGKAVVWSSPTFKQKKL